MVEPQILEWAESYLKVNGRPPGRVDLARAHGLSEFTARKVAAALRGSMLRPAGDGFSVPVEPMAAPGPDGAALWDRFLGESEKAIKGRQRVMYRHLYFDDDGPVVIAFPSDMHLGAPFTDHRRILEDQRLIAAVPRCFQVNGGDVFDNAIKHRGMMVTASSRVVDQVAMLEELLKVAGHRTLAVVSGNHDDWTLETAGVDLLQFIFGRAGVLYAPSRMHLTVHLGDAEWAVAVHHRARYNSSLNLTHAGVRLLERGQDDADVVVIGHTHEAATGTFVYKRRLRAVVRPGSYQVASDHSTRHGFNDATPTCPCVVFDPGQAVGEGVGAGFYVFHDLRQAVAVLGLLK